ncbi:MAG TPA: universal stress protein [Bryobacteraceae bacterium]|nr:universal stress protein [Bryobacteraceae bacterium]
MNFDRILFAVDLSEQSRQAAPFVKALAERFQSEVTLLHVLEPPPAWSGFPETESWQTIENISQLRDSQRTELQGFLPGAFAGLTVNRIMAEGDAAQQILSYARKQGASLIMMPTHGRGPFRGLLLGSVTAKVLHDAECPVWTGVHRPEWTTAAPEKWRRILCAVDAVPHDVRTVKWAMELAKIEGAEVRLVHALAGVPPDCMSYGGETLRDGLFQAAAGQLEKLQQEAGTELEATIEEGSPANVVQKMARDWESDLVVIGRGAIQKPLGRLRSNAYAIIRESPCPVISV